MFSYQNYTVKEYWREGVLLVLLLVNIFVWLAIYDRSPGTLRVYFLDVGQGDAIFFETPSGKQGLIDGGKNRQVVSELGRLMPFGDREIDLLIATHPDADHIGGLVEVVNRFDIGLFLEPGVAAANSLDEELRARLEKRGVEPEVARRGQVINFGDGVLVTILFPNQDVSKWDTNDASVSLILSYGEHQFLLTGDAGIKTENILMQLSRGELDVEVLKAGHHGSRTSTALHFAQTVSPEYAVISAGKDNSYGHPHPEVVKILQSVGAKIVSTAELGTVRFESDGKVLKFVP